MNIYVTRNKEQWINSNNCVNLQRICLCPNSFSRASMWVLWTLQDFSLTNSLKYRIINYNGKHTLNKCVRIDIHTNWNIFSNKFIRFIDLYQVKNFTPATLLRFILFFQQNAKEKLNETLESLMMWKFTIIGVSQMLEKLSVDTTHAHFIVIIVWRTYYCIYPSLTWYNQMFSCINMILPKNSTHTDAHMHRKR